MFLLLQIIEVALRLALVVGFVLALVAIWSMLAGKGSPLVVGCLGCGSDLKRVDVVHCSKCLGV